MAIIPMKSLLEAGVHFGHQTKRWDPRMAPYIYTARNGIYILDLQKTLKKTQEAYNLTKRVVAKGGLVLFVGTKKQIQETIKQEAEKCGTFDVLPKKEVIRLKKEMETLNTNLGGIKEMDKLPSLIFLADSKKEYICTKEARKLGIPTIGLIDSNCNPDDVDYVIPGNDDALRSVSLIAGKIADAVVEAKEGNLTEAPVDEEVETMDELVKKEGVDKIERKPRQNNRRNNYQRKDRVSKENEVEEKSEENK